jgi:adenosylmethionine---8-amino-7-oxononanoate aminotransferase
MNRRRPCGESWLKPPIRNSNSNPSRQSQIEIRNWKGFFSDDGSTALGGGAQTGYEFTRRTRGKKAGRASSPAAQPKFLSLDGAYHGDTVGAVALGHIDLFHKAYAGLLFKTDKVMSPYCYRCPFNRAKPERADAREYRKCNWECVGKVEQKFSAQKKKRNSYAAFVFEPADARRGGHDSAAGAGCAVSEIARGHGALLIADEVMTGFGRTDWRRFESGKRKAAAKAAELFACHHENVQPDFLCLAKGLTGGYLPMAATLTTQKIFDAFLGRYEEFKTFFTATATPATSSARRRRWRVWKFCKAKIHPRPAESRGKLREELKRSGHLPNVGDIRQVGLIAGHRTGQKLADARAV